MLIFHHLSKTKTTCISAFPSTKKAISSAELHFSHSWQSLTFFARSLSALMSLFFFASRALSRACCPRCTLPAPYTVWKLQRLKILRCSVWSQSPIISARRPRFRKTLHSRRCAASGEKKRWSIDGRITKKSTLKTLEKRFHQKLIASFLHRRNCSRRKLIFCPSPGWRHLFFSPLVCFDVTGHAYYVFVLR
jgi:hypothetical protein